MNHLKLNNKLIEEICSYIESGSSFRNAYLLSGVNNHTGSYWRETALKDIKKGLTAKNSLYVKLYVAMDAAKKRYCQSLVKLIEKAGKSHKLKKRL